jgi:hypothetical protein
MLPRLRLTRLSTLIFVPPEAPARPRKPNPDGRPEPADGDVVTEMSKRQAKGDEDGLPDPAA